VSCRLRFALVATLAACRSVPREAPQHAVAPAPPPDAEVHHLAELETPPAPHLLAIDWAAVRVDSDAESVALWKQIAPTGEDYEQKLAELPGDSPIPHELALALLRGGNFTCVPPVAAHGCMHAPIAIDRPAPTATFDDPCLRRVLAMWSIEQLDADDVAHAHDALRAIAAIPPPESELVATAIKAIPEADQDGRLDLLRIAKQAGQHELVDNLLGGFDEAHLIAAVRDVHIDGALEVLPADTYGAIYLHAIGDDHLATRTRQQAIAELAEAAGDGKLPASTRSVLVAASRAADCGVAAAARALDQHGDHGFVPARPHARTAAAMVRPLCVLASYEQLQRADEASVFPTYVPARGLELVKVAYEPYNEIDIDGDGDPHTERTIDLIPRDGLVVPEVDDVVRAMHHCTGASCTSDDHEFRFGFKSGPGGDLWLARLELVDRPPCH